MVCLSQGARLLRRLDASLRAASVPFYVALRPLLRRAFLSFAPDGLVGQGGSEAAARYRAYLDATALDPETVRVIRQEVTAWRSRPLLSVVMPTYNSERRFLEEAIASVRSQLYPEWEFCIADDASPAMEVRETLLREANLDPRIRVAFRTENGHISRATNTALELVRGEFVVFLDHDDLLAPEALYEVARTIRKNPGVDVIYSDDDKIDSAGCRFAPQFKPDWSPELLLSYCYVGHLKALRTSLVRDLGGLRPGFEGSQDYDLILRAAERTERIVHIPRVLYHWRAAPGSTAASGNEKPASFEAGRRALEEALARRGLRGSVQRPAHAVEAGLSLFEVRLSVDPEPPVSIVIPFRDRLDLLRHCVGSIEGRTTYRAFELVLMDNESREEETLAYLSASPHRVVRCPTPGGFNFARVVNAGVEAASHELVLLLNNDTEVISSDWLAEMVAHATRPGVGAVGAKLLYGDGRIQHAGVVVGLYGLAGPAFKLARHGVDRGYLGYADVLRNYSAVTAACLLTRRGIYRAVGGFDETHLGVAYNDVDYCLKLVARGLRIVYSPRALLLHHEGASRGFGDKPSEEQHFREKWKRYIDDDPLYNPNLDLGDEHFRIGRPRARAERPRRTAAALRHA